MENKKHISLIIPALNEEKNIGNAIDSIKNAMNSGLNLSYEIIVVDNGSEDRTLEICENKGAQTIVKKDVNVGALRNLGSDNSCGDIFVFIDADVVLTDTWGKHVAEVFNDIKANPLHVYGFTALYPEENPSFIERVWFSNKNIHKKIVNYINSGQLMVSKHLFDQLNGFNSSLVSGEDSDFSQRAVELGATLIKKEQLEAIVYGLPKTIMSFFKRERWHGYGDYQTLKIFKKSKPAMLSLLNIFLITIFTVLAIVKSWIYFPVYIISLMSLSLMAALYKNYLKINRRTLILSYFYIFYICARSMSLIDRIFSLTIKRWR